MNGIPYLCKQLQPYTESIYSKMVLLSRQLEAANLAQGSPDHDGPALIKEAAIKVITEGKNQYSPAVGSPTLRMAVANKYHRIYGMKIDPTSDVMIAAGATEGVFAAICALINPGDEVLFFEPFYEPYPQMVAMMGGIPKAIPLRFPGYSIDEAAILKAISPKTKILLLNFPHNPTGKVLSSDERQILATIAVQHNLLVIADDVYEHFTFDQHQHVPIAKLPGMWERTLTVSSTGKTFSMTGWKIGYIVAPKVLITAVTRAHQNIIFCAPTPLQEAMAVAIDQLDTYCLNLGADYQKKRDFLFNSITNVGLQATIPQGTYFMLVAVPKKMAMNDDQFAHYLLREGKVSSVPCSFLCINPQTGSNLIRLSFCKTMDVIEKADRYLDQFKGRWNDATPR